MNDGTTHSSVEKSLHWLIYFVHCQSRDFPTYHSDHDFVIPSLLCISHFITWIPTLFLKIF